MAFYALAQLRIHDPDRYKRYVAAFPAALATYGGTLLAADPHPHLIEGDWPFNKVVLIAFDTEAQLRRWMTSPDYQHIARDRAAATTATILLIQGTPSPTSTTGKPPAPPQAPNTATS